MKKLHAEELISKYIDGTISPDEKKLVEEFFLQDLKNNPKLPSQKSILQANRRTFSRLNKHVQHQQDQRRLLGSIPRFAVAATVLFLVTIGGYFLFMDKGESQLAVTIQKHDLAPGGSKALLTLANGRQIVLSDAVDGKLADQGGAVISKAKAGVITYSNLQGSTQNPRMYNKVSTPKGGIYRLVLADGTTAILNSESSITFPASFSGSNRTVSITGEVYFEVIHDAAKPFRVISKGQTVEDLGTHFDVNAYADEPLVRTTLLQGKIKVTSVGNQAVYLNPGQEANNTGQITVRNQPDTDEATAWKDGFFHFNQADIPTVMRVLGRWYNVDIEYQGKPTTRRFSGDISRDLKASKALEILSLLDIHFRIEAQKIIVIQ